MKKSISVEYVYRKDEIFLFIYVVSLFSDKNNMKYKYKGTCMHTPTY